MSVLPRVLVCDDSPTIRKLVQTILANEYECVSFASAEEVVEHAPSVQPDLILSDVLMGGMSGFDLCQWVRAQPSLKNVPVVLITGKNDDDSRATGLELGADDYLLKPIRPRELLARVRSLVRLRRSTQDLEARTHELEHANRSLQQAQTALVQAEKLATLGTLVAGIAHEINNPLAFMMSGARQLEDYAEDMAGGLALITAQLRRDQEEIRQRALQAVVEVRSIGQEITDGTRRLERITADLRAFSRGKSDRVEEVDLTTEIRRAWSMAELRGSERPTLQLDVDDLPHLLVPAHQLGQVLLNIFVNAVQAMGGPGTVKVRARQDGGSVLISIQDSGPGIPPTILNRVFDPFFTTKPPGQGTGLGLSVSFGIVQSLGGTIEAHSPPGEGALFLIRLPVRRPGAEPEALPSVA